MAPVRTRVATVLRSSGVNAPSTTFEYQGTQYLAVMSAGTLFGAGKKGDSIWLFSLNGRMESLPAPAVANARGGAAVTAVPPVVYAPVPALLYVVDVQTVDVGPAAGTRPPDGPILTAAPLTSCSAETASSVPRAPTS